MTERPTSAELLGVIAEFLRELHAQAQGETRYKLLVAAHACDIVTRDLELRPEQADDDLALLRDLVGRPGEQADLTVEDEVEALTHDLARRIRDGDFDTELESLGRRLLPMVRRKLAIARPGYDAVDARRA